MPDRTSDLVPEEIQSDLYPLGTAEEEKSVAERLITVRSRRNLVAMSAREREREESERGRDRDRQRHRHTERDRETETQGQRDR